MDRLLNVDEIVAVEKEVDDIVEEHDEIVELEAALIKAQDVKTAHLVAPRDISGT